MAKKKAPQKKAAPLRSAVVNVVKKVVEETTELKKSEQSNRVIRVGKSKRKNAACPKCSAFPTITKIRRGEYELRRCRECGCTFEIGGK